MSKAFTKGDEGVPEPPQRALPRLAAGEVRYITAEGWAALHEELERLRADGGRPEDSSLGRIQFLEALLGILTIAPSVSDTPSRVVFGCCVELVDEHGEVANWQIVGPDEAAPKRGKLSVDSPLARALLGKEEGDVVTVRRPGGEVELEVRHIAAGRA